VLVAGGALLVWQLLALDRAARTPAGRAEAGPPLLRLSVTAGGVLVALALAWLVLPADPLLVAPNVPGEVLAVGLLVLLGPLAYLAWSATSARRFVVGLGLAAAFLFVVFYPNLSGLPLPNGVHNVYQGLLPTWLYAFQFPVNTDPAVTVSLASPWPAILFGAVMVAACFVGYAAWAWRLALVEREGSEADPATGSAPA
jgi:hypothetical protein